MSRNFTTVWMFGILMWARLFAICQAEDDTECYDNCNCCKHSCYAAFGWNNVCTDYECIDGHRGARCSQLCTYNCSSCPDSATICEKCYDGFYLGQDRACKDCPATCTTCTSQNRCTSCKDGYYDKDGSSTCAHSVCPGNCTCSNNACVDCKEGFFDTTASCSKECPSNCVTCSSINLCNGCEDGYYNGHAFDDYMKPELNDCTYRCRDSCTKCESYDNCSQCTKGKYGRTCQENCSIGCKDGTCNVESGTCTCSSNFIGDQCTECAYGKYGTYCNDTCSVYCKDRTCDSLGHCNDGCITNTITGEACNSCVPGMYGELCTETCPSNCKNKACERYTRACSYDCEGNFDGYFCEICKHGKHGMTCNLDCPVNCVNSICEKETGNCLICAGNFDEDKCNVCKPGFYGPNCNYRCSVHCFNKTCATDSGVCDYGCTNGYSGDKCCVHGDNCMGCASNTKCNKCKSGYFGTLCDHICSINCLDSCDFTTGVCGDCKINHFGPFCNSVCSENCNVSHSKDRSNCLSNNGTCVFGCKDGFFGLTCDKTCKSLCIDNVCTQENGICAKGCTASFENPVCALMSGETTEVSDQNSSETIIAVLATISAVSTTALFVLIAVIILKKIRPRDRHAKGSSLQIHFDNSLVGRQNSQNEGGTVVSNQDNVAYETLEVNQEPEHMYEAANPNAPESTTSGGRIEYMNLQL